MVMRRKILAVVLVILTNEATIVTSELTTNTFLNLQGTGAGTTYLGDAWETSSVGACALECFMRYSSSCMSFIYHKAYRHCTPGSAVTTSLPAPDPASTGDLYGPPLVCDTSDGFSLQVSGLGTRVCYKRLPASINIADTVIFQAQADHKASCITVGSYLATINSADELTVATEFMPSDSMTIVGGEREVSGNNFIWTEDSSHFTSAQYDLFAEGQPDETNEMCTGLLYEGLHDVPCHMSFPGICERPMTSGDLPDIN